MTGWAPIEERDFKVESFGSGYLVTYCWTRQTTIVEAESEESAKQIAVEKLTPEIKHHREISGLRFQLSWWKDRVERLEADRSERDQDSPQSKLIRRILKVCADTENFDILMWSDDGSMVAVQCSDFFAWGCADCEEITAETLGIFEQTAVELEVLDCEFWLAELYSARVRKMRPQGAAYEGMDLAVVPLFDACGPQREPKLGNPSSRQSALDRGAKKRLLAKKEFLAELDEIGLEEMRNRLEIT